MFGYGKKTVSSSRIESNFNNLKHGVYNNNIILIRVDFVEKWVTWYRSDRLILLSKKCVSIIIYDTTSNTKAVIQSLGHVFP